MAVDVSDLVDQLKREVNPPGGSLFPDAIDSEYEGHLADSFWELTVAGYISGQTENEGIITEDVATPVAANDLSRPLQQLMIINAGMRIIRIALINLDSLFRSQAGPVEFEVRKSALTLNSAMEHLQKRYDDIVETLPNSNASGQTFYSDVLALRDNCNTPAISTFYGH